MAMVKRTAKAIAALVVVGAGEAITYGILPEKWRPWAQVVVALGAAAGVYQTRNAPAPPKAEQTTAPPAR